MRLLYGGTFDPIHEGHLAIARAASTALGARVYMLPAADPPHRAPPGASAEQRTLMLALAIAGDEQLRVDRRELDRSGPSYTVDTLAEVRDEIGSDEPLVWILGLDSLKGLAEWHDWRRIFALAHVLGVERPGTRIDPGWLAQQAPEVHAFLLPRWREPRALAGSAAGGYATLPIHPLRTESATAARADFAGGGIGSGMVPEVVARYILEQGLYGSGQDRKV